MEVNGQTWITTESMKSNESGFVMISQFSKSCYMLKKTLIKKIYKRIYLLKNLSVLFSRYKSSTKLQQVEDFHVFTFPIINYISS